MKQRFEKAVLASRGDEDALMLLKFAADGITDYVNSVCKHYYMAKILVAEKGRFESREEISSLDKSRHLAHENVIMLLRAVNRQCEKQRIEPFCDVDLNDRHAVADFCGAFANEVFNHMIEGGIDDRIDFSDRVISERRKGVMSCSKRMSESPGTIYSLGFRMSMEKYVVLCTIFTRKI